MPLRNKTEQPPSNAASTNGAVELIRGDPRANGSGSRQQRSQRGSYLGENPTYTALVFVVTVVVGCSLAVLGTAASRGDGGEPAWRSVLGLSERGEFWRGAGLGKSSHSYWGDCPEAFKTPVVGKHNPFTDTFIR